MRYDNTKKIEGGGKGGQKPKQVYEKNLSYLSGYNVISGLSQGIGSKEMGKLFVQIAPKVSGLYAANLKTWNDRNTSNANTKLSKELPLNKPLSKKSLTPQALKKR
jgi:hypothetical protein